jgi:nucleotide-binding universal stress UspA family protein
MGKILFPTDFSENADHALKFAIDLAQRLNSELVLTHVYDVALMAPNDMFTSRDASMTQTAGEMERTIKMHLNKTIEEKVGDQVSTSILVLKGSVPEEIASYCNTHEITYVVLGTQGATGLKAALMGSITSAVIRQVECPVLAIPADAPVAPFKEIVYATELRENETKYFEMTVELARLYEASVTFLHVNEDSESESNYHHSLQKFMKKTDYGRIAYVNIMMKDVVTGINSYVNDHNKDLLALTTHTHSLLDRLFHRSVTRAEALHSEVPLLAFSHKTPFGIVF